PGRRRGAHGAHGRGPGRGLQRGHHPVAHRGAAAGARAVTGLGKIDRVFLYSLVVSALFHLSMITLFSIEMRYELRPIRYYPFDIVDVSRLTPPAPADDSLLTLPGGPSPFGERPEGEDILASIPEISLPVMPFEDFGTITLRQPELSLDPRLTGEAGRPRDAWAR